MARLMPLLIFILLGILLGAGLMISDKKSEIPSPLIDKPMPTFELPNLHEPTSLISNQDLIGSPFLLNVWASWCVTCRYEHPVIEELAETGLIPIIGLNYRDARADAIQWLQRFGDPYLFHIADEPGRVAIDFGVYAAPETFLIDAKGMIRFKHIGALTPEIVQQEILPMLEQLESEG
ncbi:MAG TPA: DsbE family thiol:disulfide interchange protein [Xanthomonadales bacterium]|nr:DsbE family thiol:disulfide interchange protein [Xanthomonadales bacterium]